MNPIQWLVEMPYPIDLSCTCASVHSMADYDSLRDSEIDQHLDGEVLDAVRSDRWTVNGIFDLVDEDAYIGSSKEANKAEVLASLHRLRRAGKVVMINGKWVAA